MKIDNWVKVILDALYDGVLIADDKGSCKIYKPSLY